MFRANSRNSRSSEPVSRCTPTARRRSTSRAALPTRDGRAWDDRTLQLVFSTTKGAAAICVGRLVDAGMLSYDDAVATHWPEFAAGGKEEVTVAPDDEPPGRTAVRRLGAVARRSPRRRIRSSMRSPHRSRCGSRARRTDTTPSRTAGWPVSSCDGSTDERSAPTSPTRSQRRSVSTSGSGYPSRRSIG